MISKIVFRKAELCVTAIYQSFCNLKKPEIYEIYMKNSRIACIGKLGQVFIKAKFW